MRTPRHRCWFRTTSGAISWAGSTETHRVCCASGPPNGWRKIAPTV
ncbi:hypothetical protein T261_2518 [Streptomyces lydicus]|nr:hypothetical protein T261_2518 [Streptomyces lydicus]